MVLQEQMRGRLIMLLNVHTHTHVLVFNIFHPRPGAKKEARGSAGPLFK